MIRFISLLLIIPLIIVVATFSYRNGQSVKIDFFVNIVEIPLAAVVLLSIIVGLVLGFIINLYILIKQKHQIRQLSKQRKEMFGLTNILNSDKK